MADNVAISAGSGTDIATDDISGVHWQRVKAGWGADGTANDTSTTNPLPVQFWGFVTATTSITRPANTTAYAVDDCWSDSTSAPTSGGFTFSNMGRASGGSGVINDMIVASSVTGTLQGEVWIFDTSVTNINDNSAFVISDSEAQTLVAVIPFVLATAGANNSFAHIRGLGIGYTCVGTANLRFLIRVKNAYTPANAEVLTVRLKAAQYS